MFWFRNFSVTSCSFGVQCRNAAKIGNHLRVPSRFGPVRGIGHQQVDRGPGGEPRATRRRGGRGPAAVGEAARTPAATQTERTGGHRCSSRWQRERGRWRRISRRQRQPVGRVLQAGPLQEQRENPQRVLQVWARDRQHEVLHAMLQPRRRVPRVLRRPFAATRRQVSATRQVARETCARRLAMLTPMIQAAAGAASPTTSSSRIEAVRSPAAASIAHPSRHISLSPFHDLFLIVCITHFTSTQFCSFTPRSLTPFHSCTKTNERFEFGKLSHAPRFKSVYMTSASLFNIRVQYIVGENYANLLNWRELQCTTGNTQQWTTNVMPPPWVIAWAEENVEQVKSLWGAKPFNAVTARNRRSPRRGWAVARNREAFAVVRAALVISGARRRRQASRPRKKPDSVRRHCSGVLLQRLCLWSAEPLLRKISTAPIEIDPLPHCNNANYQSAAAFDLRLSGTCATRTLRVTTVFSSLVKKVCGAHCSVPLSSNLIRSLWNGCGQQQRVGAIKCELWTCASWSGRALGTPATHFNTSKLYFEFEFEYERA